MKLTVLLVTLLALSWAFSDDVKDDEKLSEQKDEGDLQADSGDQIPKVRSARAAYRFGPKSNLKWQTYYGVVPRNAAKYWFPAFKKFQYICQGTCKQGYYPGTGDYCYHPNKNRVDKSSNFQLLVNRDNFEDLEWKWSNWGKVPDNAIKGCGSTYVGKNKWGVGTIDPGLQAFFLPWQKKKLDLYRSYYALTVNADIIKQGISHVQYFTKKMFVYRNTKPATLRSSIAINYQCREATQSVSLTKAIETEDRWDISNSVTASVSTTVEAGVPFITSSEVSVGVETSMEIAKGTSNIKSTEHSVSIDVTVPANHECRVEMMANKYKADIPFIARLVRKYRNGKTTATWVKGHYKKHQISEIRAVIRRCVKIPGSKPCD